jgi:hypothetical protein
MKIVCCFQRALQEINSLGLGRGDVGLEKGNNVADGLEHCNLFAKM